MEVGECSVDVLVEDVFPIELVAVKVRDDTHRVQRMNYLKATGLPLCFLRNVDNSRIEINPVVHGR